MLKTALEENLNPQPHPDAWNTGLQHGIEYRPLSYDHRLEKHKKTTDPYKRN